MRSEVWLVQPWTPRQGQPYSVAGTGSLGVQSRTSDTVVRRKGPWPQDTACDSGSPVLAENNKIYGLQTVKILDRTDRKCWKVRWTLLCSLSKKREHFKSHKASFSSTDMICSQLIEQLVMDSIELLNWIHRNSFKGGGGGKFEAASADGQ